MMLASVAQLEARLGEPVGSLAGEDLARATAALEDASAIVLTVGLPTWTDAAGANPAPATVQIVALRLARRFWDNPEGLAYEAMGDRTVSRKAADSFLTVEERALVLEAAGFSTGVYSVGTPGVWS